MLLILGAVAALSIWPPPPAAAIVSRGVDEHFLPVLDGPARQVCIDEIWSQLRARVVRIDVFWPAAEPARGAYSESYLAGVTSAVAYAASKGLKVVVTVQGAPSWAQDSSLWANPPASYPSGVPQSFYALDRARLGDLRRFVADLAVRLDPNVYAYECWNEPNLWPYIYPQRTADDEHFAARLYVAMLRAFRSGLQDAGSPAKLVAGATAPIGLNDKYRTSPQKFARFLRDAGAGELFDAYSHHPYVPGGSRFMAPDQPPNDPTTTVTLYNLRQLLDLFPAKPFYLTEYGYNTEPCLGFGGTSVTQVQQAVYLRKAYRYAARYPQVRMLVWYMVKDFQYGPERAQGVYSGLRTTSGARKLSWFVFAGGNRLTLEAPRAVRAGTTARLRGVLTNASIGAVQGRSLELQVRSTWGGWRTLKTTTTGGDGRYRFYLTPFATRAYRVLWRGVRTSETCTVQVY